MDTLDASLEDDLLHYCSPGNFATILFNKFLKEIFRILFFKR